MFFSFDGIDGVGKSTQVKLFVDALRRAGNEVVTCRDPGTTSLGERIRDLLLHDDHLSIDRRSEMLLYMAARAQMVDEVIRPALAAGKVVVSDRYVLANIVYQGHAGGLDPESIRRVGNEATGGVEPDSTFLLDLPTELADSRMRRTLDRMEQQGADYRLRLRAGFLIEAERQGSRIYIIDASKSIEAIHAEIWQIACQFSAISQKTPATLEDGHGEDAAGTP
jgi:dTMP kinase